MNKYLTEILEEVRRTNPIHWNNIKSDLSVFDSAEYTVFDPMIRKFAHSMRLNGYTLSDIVSLYNKMLLEVIETFVFFKRTGQYPYNLSSQVSEALYTDEKKVTSFAIASFISELLWKQHFLLFFWYIINIEKYKNGISSYLDIGGSHGQYTWYLSEAAPTLPKTVMITNPVSEKLIDWIIGNNENISVTKKLDGNKYSWITMGETLEHYENPGEFILLAKKHLIENGYLFITAPINAPALDHVFHFRSEDDIRSLVGECSFELLDEAVFYSNSRRVGNSLDTRIYAALFKLR